MYKRVALFVILILGICGLFFLGDIYQNSLFWAVGVILTGVAIRYGGNILLGGNSGRLVRYLQKRKTIRYPTIKGIIEKKILIPNDITSEECAALISLAITNVNMGDDTYPRVVEFLDDHQNDPYLDGFLDP
ncbi:MAG: hypothetical protein JXB15_11130 [Anaerolineales bacterium]|nr:hypothetical protein [Anaerolineales bacterium]